MVKKEVNNSRYPFKISVVVPVYNGASSLGRLLYEIDQQTIRSELQVIFIDDGSTDSSLSILRNYQASHLIDCIVLTGENRGASHARNRGLECAEGEYIGFVDCDDRIDSSLFEKLYNTAYSCNDVDCFCGADVVVCGYYRVNGDDYWKRDAKKSSVFSKNIYQAPGLIRKNRPFIWNKIFSKSLIDRESFRFDENLQIYEDLVFTYCALCAANRVEHCPEALYSYTWSSAGSLTNVFSEKRLDLMRAFDLVCDYYKRKNALIICEENLVYSFLEHLYVALDADYPNNRSIADAKKLFRSAISWLNARFPWWKKYKAYYRNNSLSPLLWRSSIYVNKRICKWAKRGKDAEAKLSQRLRKTLKSGINYCSALEKPIEPTRLLLDPQHGKIPNGNTLSVFERIYSKQVNFNDGSPLDVGFACTNRNKEEMAELLEKLGLKESNRVKITLLPYLSKQYMEYLATARVIMTDASMTATYIHRENQILYNFWHGTPLKSLGRDLAQEYQFATPNITKNFVLADYLCFMSEFQAEKMEKAYMYKNFMHGKTWLSGYPRNDRLADQVFSETIREKLGIDKKIKLVAYMPTWRGLQAGDHSTTKVSEVLRELDKKCPNNVRILLNLHPYEARASIGRYNHIVKFPKHFAVYDVLAACDILVTDYSSVLFDWALSKKKCILFPFDEESYAKDRGMYIMPSETGLSVVYDVEELIEEINNPKILQLKSKFMPTQSANSSSVIADSVISIVRDNKEASLFKPSSKNNSIAALIFADDFRNARLNNILKEYLSNHSSSFERIVIGYDADIVSNYEILKLIPKDIAYWGTMKSFMVSSLQERDLLAKVRCNPFSVDEKDIALLDGMAQTEWRRSYGGFVEKTIICISDRVERIVFATCSRYVKKSVLYIPSCELVDGFKNLAIYSHTPLLSRFDQIVVDEKIKVPFQNWLNNSVPNEELWQPQKGIDFVNIDTIEELAEI